jgi:hypothetical protein
MDVIVEIYPCNIKKGGYLFRQPPSKNVYKLTHYSLPEIEILDLESIFKPVFDS